MFRLRILVKGNSPTETFRWEITSISFIVDPLLRSFLWNIQCFHHFFHDWLVPLFQSGRASNTSNRCLAIQRKNKHFSIARLCNRLRDSIKPTHIDAVNYLFPCRKDTDIRPDGLYRIYHIGKHLLDPSFITLDLRQHKGESKGKVGKFINKLRFTLHKKLLPHSVIR